VEKPLSLFSRLSPESRGRGGRRRLSPKGRNCAKFKNGSHHKMRGKRVQNNRLPELQICPARAPCGSISSADVCEAFSKEGSLARFARAHRGQFLQKNAMPSRTRCCVVPG